MTGLKLTSALAATAAVSCAWAASNELPKQPNVIFILTDDQGYGDLGCLGNDDIKTPNIDQFYSKSVSFSDFHSGTTSAPTRSGLMTGHYNNCTGVWHTIKGRSLLDLEEYTVAEAFSDSGYTTAMFGKWHLGDNYPYRPTDRGFDYSLIHGGGGIGQAPDYWGNTYFDDTYLINGEKRVHKKGYCTDIWFSEALKFIKKNRSEPFFCYLAVNAPHHPYHVDEKYAAQYRGNENIVHPEFYGMISNIDDNVGVLLQRLEELGIADNTIVVFMTDNGTAGGVSVDRKTGTVLKGYNAGMRGQKASNYEGGHRVPFFINVPGAKSRSVSTLASHIDFMPTMVDLCGLKIPSDLRFDGMSLAPAIKGGELENRMLCVDTQRGDILVKDKVKCVMDGTWRLTGRELYDLSVDPSQTNDIAAQHPERVAKMDKFYEEWWGRNTARANDVQYIGINPDGDNEITTHDLHVPSVKLPAWSQNLVRQGAKSDGKWYVEIYEDGEYDIELRRWAQSTNAALQVGVPEGREIPNGERYKEGVKLAIVEGKISIGDFSESKSVEMPSDAKAVEFSTTLKKGKYELKAYFTDDKGAQFASYYVYFKRR